MKPKNFKYKFLPFCFCFFPQRRTQEVYIEDIYAFVDKKEILNFSWKFHLGRKKEMLYWDFNGWSLLGAMYCWRIKFKGIYLFAKKVMNNFMTWFWIWKFYAKVQYYLNLQVFLQMDHFIAEVLHVNGLNKFVHIIYIIWGLVDFVSQISQRTKQVFLHIL